MMTEFRAVLPIFLGVAACSPGSGNEAGVAGSAAASPSAPRIQIEATYDPSLGNNIGLTFRNGESFPMCFSSNDLLPGFGTTFVRDATGTLLSGQTNPALEDFRGVNLASAVTVLRPGRDHLEQVNLERDRPNPTLPVIIQVGIRAFRCSALFDGGNRDVDRTLIEKTFQIQANLITEYRGPRLENNEEAPPNISPR